MPSKENDYWFTIEPYTYAYIKGSQLLLFNTLDGSIIEENDENVINLVRQTLTMNNLSVSFFEGKKLTDKNIELFISKLRDAFMGDLIEVNHSCQKPIQFISNANILDFDFNKEKERLFNNINQENVLYFLDEVTILINGYTSLTDFMKQTWLCSNNDTIQSYLEMSIDLIKSIGTSLQNTNVTTINIIGSDLSKHTNINEIVSFFKTLSINIEYIQHGNSINDYITTNIIDASKLNTFIPNTNITYIFIVESNKELEATLLFIQKNLIEKYKIIPFFNQDNYAFFQDNVFINKEDLENEPQKMNDIYAKHFINLNHFGKLFVSIDGNVYSSLYNKPIGKFNGSFKELILKELSMKESTWRNTRESFPCCNCIYQWLCPSPTKYELAIKKNNLCTINEK